MQPDIYRLRMILVARAWWLVVIAACSPPREPTHHPIANAAPDAAPDVPVYTFDWEAKRAVLEAIRDHETPCDYRKHLQDGIVPDGCEAPDELAVRVSARNPGPKTGSHVVVDAGANDGVTMDWWGALLDERGHAIEDWVHPIVVHTVEARFHLDRPLLEIDKYRHAVLRRVRP